MSRPERREPSEVLVKRSSPGMRDRNGRSSQSKSNRWRARNRAPYSMPALRMGVHARHMVAVCSRRVWLFVRYVRDRRQMPAVFGAILDHLVPALRSILASTWVVHSRPRSRAAAAAVRVTCRTQESSANSVRCLSST